MKRPFAVIGFTVFLTIAFLFDKKTGVTVAALAAFAVALVIALFSKKLREAKAVPVCMASGAVACIILLATNLLLLEPLTSFAGKTHHMKARITSEAVLEYGKYYYNAKAITIGEEKINCNLRLVFSEMPDVAPYDYIEGSFAFYQPGMTDEVFLEANRANGLFLGAYPTGEDCCTVTSVPENEKPAGYHIIRFRNAVKRAVYRVYPNERGALAVAMLMGDRSGIPADIYNNMRVSGTAHLVCVSGLHLSMWAMFVLDFLRRIGLREKLACVVAAVGVVGFMAITGFSYSVLRAGIMMLVYLAASLVSRKADSINSLGFSLMAISLISPYAMSSLSLQLSAFSTLGIVSYNEYVRPEVKLLLGKIKRKRLRSAVSAFADALLVTMSATLFIQPIMLEFAGGFSFASIISNLTVTPFAGGAMSTSALAVLADLFVPRAVNLFRYIAGLFLQYIISVSGFVADFDILKINLDRQAALMTVGAVFVFFAFAVFLTCFYKPKPLVASVLACAVFFTGVMSNAYFRRNETLVRVIDTGNGVCVLFMHGGESVLVGCGGTDFMGANNISFALKNIGSFDCLVIPSAHETSSAYALSLLSENRPDKIYFDALPENAEFLIGRSENHSLAETYKSKNFTVKFSNVSDKPYIFVETENLSSLICASPLESVTALPEGFRKADLAVCRGAYPADIAADFVAVCAEKERGLFIENELSSKGIPSAATGGYGDLVIRAENGDMSIRRE